MKSNALTENFLPSSVVMSCPKKFWQAYSKSRVELQPLVNDLLDKAFEIGKHIEKFAAGKITRKQIPLPESTENDLIIGLLVRMSRETYLGNERINWDE